MLIEGQVGPQVLTDGVNQTIRQGKSGEAIFTELHGRFYEQSYRGNLFMGGMTLTSVNNATFTTATLGVTGTPIAGVYNPATSGKNLVILQVRVIPVNTALQTTGIGALMWASSVGNTAVSTGNTPFNLGTGVAGGSVAKDMCGVAMTAQTNALVVRGASALAAGNMSNLSTLQTAAGLMPTQAVSIENTDGMLIVPPGGLLGLLGTSTPVAISMASSIIWEEVAV